MFERFTDEARQTLFFSRYAVTERGGDVIEPEHVVLGAIRQPDAFPIKLPPGGLNAIEEALNARISRHARPTLSQEIPFSMATRAVIERAAQEADDLRNVEIRTGHLLLGILVKTDGVAAQTLREAGITIADLRAKLAASSSSNTPG